MFGRKSSSSDSDSGTKVGWPAKPGETPNRVAQPVKNPSGKGAMSRPKGKPKA